MGRGPRRYLLNNTARTYGQEFIYGSVAYDFGNVDFAEEFPVEREVEVAAPPRVEEKTESKARPALHTAQAIAPFSIIGFVCAAVLMVFMLMSYIRLTEVSEKSVDLERQLSELAVEQTRLLIDYESAFNMTEIEEYATSVLGMQKPRSDQVFYVDGSAPDKAEIIEDETQKSGVLGMFDDLLESLGEYFG